MASAVASSAYTAAAAVAARPARRVAAHRVASIPKRPRHHATTVCIASPMRSAESVSTGTATKLPDLISRETVRTLEAELDNGTSIAALRRFNDNLRSLPADQWEARLRPVMAELAFNLESFNPAFTAVLLKVQSTIGRSDYVRRDVVLKNLIQPLAGEYGMHNDEPQARTHRELFSMFYGDIMRDPLERLMAEWGTPAAAELLFAQMMRDIMSTQHGDEMAQACYAMGYNLAIEYLADYEKTWMLDSFRELDARVLAPQGRPLTEWVFLEVHAEGEAEHAAIGHNAVASFVPASAEGLLRRAMQDHDRDFAAFYNHLADLLEC